MVDLRHVVRLELMAGVEGQLEDEIYLEVLHIKGNNLRHSIDVVNT